MGTASGKVEEYIAEREAAGQAVSPGDCLRLREGGRRLDSMTLGELDREDPLTQGGPFAGFFAGLVRTLRDEAGSTPAQIAAAESREGSYHGGDEQGPPATAEDLAAVEAMHAQLAEDTARQNRERQAADVRSRIHDLSAELTRGLGETRRVAAHAELATLKAELAGLTAAPSRPGTGDITSAEAMRRARERMAREGDTE